MNTTALRIELLVIGLQSSIWVFFLLDVDNSYQISNGFLQIAKDFSVVTVLVFLAVSYTAGLAIDSLTAFIKTIAEYALEKIYPIPHKTSISLSIEVRKKLNSSEYETRLLRSTWVNFILIGTFLNSPPQYPNLSFYIVLSGVFVMLAWLRRTFRIHIRRKRAYETSEA